MSEHDFFDDELGAALRSRVGGVTASTAAAHDAVLQRAGTIRRRRAMVAGSSAMALMLLGGVLLLPRDDAGQLRPADTGDVVPTIEDVSSSLPDGGVEPDGAAPATVDVTIPGPDSSSVPAAGVADDDPTADDTVDGESAGTAAPVTTGAGATSDSSSPAVSTAPTSTPSTSTPSTSAPDDTTVSTSSSPASSTPTSSTPTTSNPTTSEPATSSSTPTVAPFTDTFGSDGGSITVSWNGSAFTLLAVSPAAGFTSEIEEESATRIRVRFRSDDDDHRIDVRVEEGELRVVVD